MKLIGVRATMLVAGVIVAASCISCSQRATNNGPTAVSKITKPGPEESFNVIMDTFRRRMEETPIGFVVTNPNGRSTMMGANKVSSKLIPPANDTESYKAVVTVESQSQYSVKRGKEDAADENTDDQNVKDQKSPNAFGDENKVGEIFDPGVPTKTTTDSPKPHSTTRSTDESVARHPDKEVRNYELLYQNGRWKLVSELKLDTEQSIQNAFKDALATQI